jgi:enamine deaminase RidA (YjgF/YER057c/UK114 family)
LHRPYFQETSMSRSIDEIDRKIAALGLSLPMRPIPIANFLPFRVSASTVYLAGQTCELDGRVVLAGCVGEDVTFEAAREAAKICALNLLSSLREACDGRLDRVSRCLRVGGFVQAKQGFPRVPAVVDGASELFIALWGERGRHARTAVGVSTLPQNASVEVDAIFELRSES